MVSKNFSLLDLNHDCLFEIFQKILDVSEKIKLKRVCRKFLAAINEYFSCHSVFIIYPFQFGSHKVKTKVPLENIFINCPKLTELDTTLFRFSLSDKIEQIDPMLQLTFLSLDDYSTNLTINQLENLFKKCPNLQRLSLINFFRKLLNYNCLGNCLQELFLYHISFETFEKIMQIRGKKIVTLVLNPGDEDINQFYQTITNFCPNLKELSIYSPDSNDLNVFLPKLKCLEKLDIFSPTVTVKYSQLMMMLQSMPNLRSLLLCIRNAISVQLILDLCCSYCVKIEIIQINLTLNDLLNKDELDTWQKLKNLRQINGQMYEYWKNVFEKKMLQK